ncbi:hypothetical protein TNCV_2340441 [Trichonephila clavipes]|nr:hypothetical protein TNCV_2340441 [Trichonephila clavipes]
MDPWDSADHSSRSSGGCGSPVVKVLNHGRHVMSSSPAPLKTHRDLGLNPGEGMDVCKYIEPMLHGGTQNSCRAANPLVGLVEGDER